VAAPQAPPAPPPDRPRSWPAVLPFVALAGVGLLLRLHELGQRAYHHDESLHAVYSWYLYVGRGYVHDPLMHGPFQFHASALIYFLFGDSDVTGRLAAVLFGTAIILLPYFLRGELGRRGAIVAALIFTIGPTFLYFSRFTREDIFLAFFTLGMVVGIFGWIRTRNVRYLYFGSLSLICAFADKEATYIHGFVFVTFFALLWATSPLHGLLPPVLSALRDIKLRTWIECVAIFVGIYVLLFTTFFTNLGDPWNCLRGRPCNMGGLWSGSIGALQYWLDQHGVQRGGQPIYYYVLLLGLYEFLPVIFGAAALATRWFRTSLFGWFCVYWFVGNFAIYSWAGEKMPWLVPHIATPLVLLAARWIGDWLGSFEPRSLLARPALAAVGLSLLVVTCGLAFLAVGAFRALSPLQEQSLALERLTLAGLAIAASGGLIYLAFVKRAPVRRSVTAAALVFLTAFYVHTSWMVTYAHGDIPVEMLVYVQSSPDVPWVIREIERIGFQTSQRQDLRILMDNGYTEDVNGQRVVHEAVSWPFEWYLRDYKNRRYFSKTFGPDINLRDYPAILVMGPNLDPIRDQLQDYSGQKYRLNWWYPEDYKNWRTNPGIIWSGLTDPATRARVLKYLIYREPLNPLGAREFYFFVRKEIPSIGPAPGTLPPRTRAAAPPAALREATAAQLDGNVSLWGIGRTGEPLLVEPKGLAVGPDGRLFVAEARANRVTVFNPDGSFAASWGRGGTGPGEFAEPWGIAVSPRGEVFVADTWNHRVQKLGVDGRPIHSWGQLADTRGDPNASPGQFWGPRDIAIGPDGLLYVSDTGNKRIQVFDADGNFVRAFGGAGPEPGKFNEPVGLAIQGDTLFVADAWNGRVQRLGLDGSPRGAIPVAGWESKAVTNKPYIAVDGQGLIYTTAPERGDVLAVAPDGQARAVARPSDGAGRLAVPTGLTVGPNGELYVAESGGGVVSRYARPEVR
jgi:uncharacterized protein (TIGR03663 family)